MSGWIIGQGESESIEVFAGTVSLEPELKALMVTEQAGFEHTHRTHALYAAIGGKLKKLWSADEGAGGPRSTSVEIVAGPGAKAAFIHFDSFYYHEAVTPDRWDWTAYRWDAKKRSVAALPRTKGLPELHAAIVGSFPTVAEAVVAHEQLDTDKHCLGWRFLVLKSGDFSMLTPKLNIVAAVDERKERVEKALADAKACNPIVSGYVKRAN